MKSFTRIVFFIRKSCFYIQRKNSFFKEVFSFALFTLFFGFLVGNLFGTFLNTIRFFILWDGFIILIIIFIMECYNCFLYNRFFKKFVIKIVSKEKGFRIPFAVGRKQALFFGLRILCLFFSLTTKTFLPTIK